MNNDQTGADSSVKWTDARTKLLQQVIDLDATIRKKKEQDAELGKAFMTWWELLRRRYGAQLAKLLEAYKTEELSTFNNIHREERNWHPASIKIVEREIRPTTVNWHFELFYPNVGVEIDVWASVAPQKPIEEGDLKLVGFDIQLNRVMSEEDEALKQMMKDAQKKEEEAKIVRTNADKAFQAWWKEYLRKNEQEVVRMLNVAAGLAPAFPTSDPQVVTTMVRGGDITSVRVFEMHFRRLGLRARLRAVMPASSSQLIRASDVDEMVAVVEA